MIKKRRAKNANLKFSNFQPSDEGPVFLTPEGSLVVEDVLVNRDGIQNGSQNGTQTVTPSENRWSIEDLNPIKTLGRGVSGIVRLVQHKKTGEFYAFKVIKLNLDENERKAIVRELKINQSVEYPYVVRCYQAFYDDGEILFLLEYMDCGTLADLLAIVKQIPEKYLAAICKQLLLGLSYLHHHHKHIIHRDLKPSNLLINQKGEAKIGDFGVSAETKYTYGKADTCAGTKFYMAPERITEDRNHDHKSDIWSLGLVLLQCAIGRFPYSFPEQCDDYMIVRTIAKQPPPSAPSNQFSSNFCLFISSCLQKDPRGRESARKLMEHPFITMYDNTQIDLSGYFINAFGTSRNF